MAVEEESHFKDSKLDGGLMLDDDLMARIAVQHLSSETPVAVSLIDDIRRGFETQPRELPPKYFYDVDGSGIFEKITELPEYYVTRTEAAILTEHAEAIMESGPWSRLVELGSGASKKTRALLDAMPADDPVYSPFDISHSALLEAASKLVTDYETLRVEGFIGDFLTEDIESVLKAPSPKLVAFIGSTLGNLTETQRNQLYRGFGAHAGEDDGLLIGVDLVKEPHIIEPAYNDRAGVTAEFNKNVLRVLQRELGATVLPEDFYHHAPYVLDKERIEMRLYAERDVEISFPDNVPLSTYSISDGEYILTELSQKFTQRRLEAELSEANLSVENWWTDERDWVGLALVRQS